MTRPWPAFFDPDWYLTVNPDVAQSAIAAERHYLLHGRHEGRQPLPLRSWWYDRDLRWGMLEGGEAAVQAMVPEATGAEALWLRVVLARAAARRNDWAKAADWLAPLSPTRDLVDGFALIDVALLGIETALASGQTKRAAAILAHATRRFGRTPDLRLAAASVQAAQSGFGFLWRWHMKRLFAPERLVGLRVAPGAGAPLNRLQASTALPQTTGPLVTIVVPVRNAAATLPTAVRSLQDQSWKSLEILIVENDSTDATVAVAHKLARSDPRIRVMPGAQAETTYDARNLGMAQAKGDFVTVLDADDWAHPQRIARQMQALSDTPSAAGALCFWVRTTSDLSVRRWWKDDGLLHPDVSSLMLRRETREALGFWDRVRAGGDTEYLDRLRHRFGPSAVCEVARNAPLGFGRLLQGSLTEHTGTTIQSHVYGERRSYTRAAQRWHRRTQDLSLVARPETRPFPAPNALAVGASNPPSVGPERMIETGLFDDAWYMATYPDLRAQDVDGLSHYVDQGALAGRDPGPLFSTSGFALKRGLTPDKACRQALDEGPSADWLPTWVGHRPRRDGQDHIMIFGHSAGPHVFGAERVLPQVLDQAARAGVACSVTLPNILSVPYLDHVLARCNAVHIRPYGRHFEGVAPRAETVDVLAKLLIDEQVQGVHQMTCVLDAPLTAARQAGCETTVHLHESPWADPILCLDMGTTPGVLRRRLLRASDRFACVSKDGATWLNVPNRTSLWVNSVDPQLSALPLASTSPCRVALIGSLTRRKGLADFIEIGKRIMSGAVPLQLVLVGPDSEDLRRSRPLPDVMTHTGYAEDPGAALAQAHVVVNLSLFEESHGLSVHEALVAGRPVVAYDQPAMRALLGDCAAGILVPKGDIEGVLSALRKITAPDTLPGFAQAARARGAQIQQQAERQGSDLFRIKADPAQPEV